jgi:hypothetical protein
MTDKLRIKQKNVCSHKILPKHCSSCQIQTFLLCLEEKKIYLLNDLKKLLFTLVQKNQKAYLVDLRYASDEETFEEEKHHSLCDGLMPADTPYPKGILEGKLDKLRIVFIGSEESYYGFFFCLIVKYMTATFCGSINEVESFNIDKKLAREISDRWFKNSLGTNQNRKSYIEISMSYPWDENIGFAAKNLPELFKGYQKMLELDIKEVFSRARCQGTLVSKSIINSFMWSDRDIFCPQIKTCTAYWYYID